MLRGLKKPLTREFLSGEIEPRVAAIGSPDVNSAPPSIVIAAGKRINPMRRRPHR